MSELCITRHKVAEIHYTLTNDKGETMDSSRDGEPLPYIHGTESLVPGLEKELEGKTIGDALTVSLSPEDAYGPRIDELQQQVERALFQFDGDIEVGMRFEAQAEHGVELVTVVAVDDTHITIDANHPLAGETLNFDVEVMTIRDATEEELAHGHVHQAGGCGHDHG
jgi:FKBP-type peptidyl-prolyl cis-trans isomerase SlyD